MTWQDLKDKLRVLKSPISWPGDAALIWKIVKWIWGRIGDYQEAASLKDAIPKAALKTNAPHVDGLSTDTWVFIFGVLWLTLVVMFSDRLLDSFGGKLRRLRSLVRQLTNFVDKNEGNTYKIHFGYDAEFRPRVDRMFSELAAEEIIEIVDGDWVINPQTQTAKNIRENVIARLERLADKLEKRQSAPRSKIVGSIEEAHVLSMGSGVDHGKQTRSTMIGFRLRVTNKARIETSVKRAHVIVRTDGEEYKGSNQALWLTSDKPRKDFLKSISSETPITHSLPTEGWIDFLVDGLEVTRGLIADVSVILIDEFEVPHVIRNRALRIAV
jgi:hypothetical protein